MPYTTCLYQDLLQQSAQSGMLSLLQQPLPVPLLLTLEPSRFVALFPLLSSAAHPAVFVRLFLQVPL
uniref:Uncharacterized protein n=1 Tax=Arundo donax TaxID=35708 RepID=A0A0A9CU78_ARUDO